MNIEVLALGELLIDLIAISKDGGLEQASTFERFQGGSPANLCVNLMQLGHDSQLVACVGQDSFGNYLIDALSKAGISTQTIHKTSNHSTSLIVVGGSSTPDFIAYRNADMHVPRIDIKLIEQSAIVHTSAFALSKNPAQQNILSALHLATSKGKVISIDWNYSPRIWENDGKSVFEKLMKENPRRLLLKFSEDDINRFTSKQLNLDGAKAFLNDYPTLATCLTCGKDGVWYKSMNTDWKHAAAIPVSKVANTTGAGDAFWAGFLSGWLKNLTLDFCVTQGLTCAATKIQHVGPLNLSL
jgi:fructokinase